jgi:hypothetical protein
MTRKRRQKRPPSRYASARTEFLALQETVLDLLRKGFDALNAHKLLREKGKLTMSYCTFARYFKQFKQKGLPATAVGSKSHKPLPQAQAQPQVRKLPLLSASAAPGRDREREEPRPGERFQLPPQLSLEEVV